MLKNYAEFLSRADHKARMERLLATDKETALRAAHRLGGRRPRHRARAPRAQRQGQRQGGGNGAKLLESVPAEAHHDPGYIFARLHVLRHKEKIAEAAQAVLSASREAAEANDPEEWWVERRMLARKLLDNGDARSAYLVMRDAADPIKENSRVERHFMAGWIALRFLKDPATAVAHFSRIQDVSIHPTSLARSHYWLGRAAEAAHRPGEARAEYEAAARSSAAYYGQLARARLGFAALALAPPPATPDQSAGAERLELVRALEILYALNERALVITFMADIGDKLDDVGVLVGARRTGGAAQGRARDAASRQGRARPRPAARLLRVSDVGVPRYSPIGPAIDSALRVRHHSPGERVRSGRLVERPGDGPDAGDAGRRRATPASASAASTTPSA